MKKFLFLYIVVFLLSIESIIGQNLKYSSLSIPPELKENANAVVRNQTTEISIEDADKMIVRKKRVVTILNKLGNRFADIYQQYNNHTTINKLSVEIVDAFGNKIKKFSKNKFSDVSAVDDNTLYSDSRIKYLDYTPISYPYTIIFESEYRTSSTGFIPRWYLIENYL